MTAEQILNYWNSRPNIGIIHSKPESKVYQNSLAALATLLSGQFGRRYQLDQDYMADFGIIDKELHKEWSEDEIKQAIDRFDYMCSDAHVADKQYYPKNLPEFMYNPRTEKSFIMTLLGEYKEISGLPLKMLEPKAVYYYHNYFWYGKDMDANSQNLLIRNINYITRQQWAFEEKMGQWCYYHELNGFGFYRYHLKYIEQNYQDRDDFRIDHLGPMTYAGFGPWLLENHSIVLTPGREDIEKAKIKYAADTIKIEEINREEAERLAKREEWLKQRVWRRARSKESQEPESLAESNGEGIFPPNNT